jgi:hypothetical protein
VSGPEKKLQDQCLDWLKSQDIYYLNTHGNSFEERGRPDILICHRGKFIGIELKRGVGSVPTPIQLRHLRRIRENGGIGVWITTLEELIEEINHVCGYCSDK